MEIDRTTWGPGPWDVEPDRLEWTTGAGLPAIARRTELGIWCGYVAVRPGHPLHGVGFDDERLWDLPTHGGITYAVACHGDVCHRPPPGEPDDVWWLGFDCGHSGDLLPGLQRWHGFGIYRTLDYVRDTCEELAAYLARRAP